MESLEVVRLPAAALAQHVDATFAARWSDALTMLYVLSAPATGRVSTRVSVLAPNPYDALQRLPTERCVAACVTSLGAAVRLDMRENERLEVRVTVAVDCCQNVALVRHVSGRVEQSSSCDGDLLSALRRWAELERCESCMRS